MIFENKLRRIITFLERLTQIKTSYNKNKKLSK